MIIDDEIKVREEEALEQETLKFQVAWSEGDAGKISRFFTEDCRRVGAFGEIQNGRAEVEAAYKMLLERALPGAKLLKQGKVTRFLTLDLAIWQESFQILSPDSPEKIKGYVVLIMKKEEGKWMILEMHPKIFPNPSHTTL